MSEKKTKSQELEAKIEAQNQLLTTLQNRAAEMEKDLLTMKAAKATTEALPSATHVHQEAPPQSPPSKPSESGLEHYKNCPTCHKAINEEARKEIEPEIIKNQREKLLKLKAPVICEGCGEIVEGSEPKCPGCGGTKTRKFNY